MIALEGGNDFGGVKRADGRDPEMSLGRLAMRVPIRQLGIGKAAHGGGPSPVSVNVVTAYAQDLGILLLEPAVELPEQGGLVGSTRGEIEYVEGEDHVFFASILAERDVSLTHRGKGKIGGGVANFCGHVHSFPFSY